MQEIYSKINRQLVKWISCADSNREFALNHNIDEKTVRRILAADYKISIGTLKKICEARNLPMADFFRKIEKGKT